MFQFTTTTVINSNQDFTTGKPLWSTRSASAPLNEPATFYVKRVNKFISTNVLAVYKAVATDPEMAKANIDLSRLDGSEGDIFRLNIYIAPTQASQSSLYANDLETKGKPLSVDFVWKSDAATTAEKLVKAIKKNELMVYGQNLLKVNNYYSYLTVEATDEYQRFRYLNIEKFDAEAHHGMGEYNVVRSLDDLVEVEHNSQITTGSENYFKGKEGFGTYSWLLHNLRLPTHYRTRFAAPNQDETPIIGAKYNQYTIHYCVNRGILGTNAVGDLVKSKTTHVFYVNQNVANDFEIGLRTLCPDMETIGKSEMEALQNFKEDLYNLATVKLQASVSVDTPFEINKGTLINLGGHKVTATNEQNAFVFTEGNSTIENGSIESGNKCVYAKGGEVTIKSGNFLATSDGGAECVMVSDSAHVIIEGGTFESQPVDGRYWTLNKINSASSAKIEVKGGKFKGFDPANPNTDDDSTYLADGYKSQKVGDYYVVTKA